MKPKEWYLQWDEKHPRAQDFIKAIQADGAIGAVFEGVDQRYYGFNTEYGYTWCQTPGSYERGKRQLITLDEYFEELPEKWCILRTNDNYIVVNQWFLDQGCNGCSLNSDYIRLNTTRAGKYSTTSEKPDGYTEITFDQFKRLVLKQKEMTYTTINRAAVKTIHEAACDGWKQKIIAHAKMDDPFKDAFEFSQEFVNSMYDAANAGQKQILNRYFEYKENSKNTFKKGAKLTSLREIFDIPEYLDVIKDLTPTDKAEYRNKAILLPNGYKVVTGKTSNGSLNWFTIEKE